MVSQYLEPRSVGSTTILWRLESAMKTVSDRYRHWFAHEAHAHAKLFESLRSVPEAGRSSPEYHRAIGLVAHLVAARATWLFRLGGGPKHEGGIFPADRRLEDVQGDWSAVEGRWSEFLAGLDDADLTRDVEYQSSDGGRFHNTVEEILTQLVGHSPYHRGQIAMLVHQAGGTPALTDYIYWRRKPLA